MIKIQGIDHAAINVRDFEKSVKFYTKILSLSISKREIQKPGKEYFLDCGPSLFGIIQADLSKGEHLLLNDGVGGNHVSFSVKAQDFDEAVASLKQHKVKIHFSKKRERSWSVYFEDPDGNKLEMTAWPQEDLVRVERTQVINKGKG